MMGIRNVLKRVACGIIGFAILLSAVTFGRENAAQADAGRAGKTVRVVVSLGDSYASGEGNTPFFGQEIKDIRERKDNVDAWEGWLAHRSKHAWSGQIVIDNVSAGVCVPMEYGKNWFFAASSGARTVHIDYSRENNDRTKRVDDSEKEKTYNRDGLSGTYYLPGQLNIFNDGLGSYTRDDVDYVTVSIGGNDMEFVEVLKTAAVSVSGFYLYEYLQDKLDHFYDYPNGGYYKIRDAYKRIAKAAPNATIIVVGYPQLLSYYSSAIFQGHLGNPLFNIFECKFIDDAVSEFNRRLELIVKECQEHGMKIEFCPVEEEFKWHLAYSLDPYIHPIKFGAREQDLEWLKVTSDYSMHPNEAGMKVYAKCVEKTINEIERRNSGFTTPQPPGRYDPWVDAYRRFITDREYLSASPGQYLNDEPHRFGLYDMDGSGIPELLIYNGDTSHGGSACIVYSYVNGGIREIGRTGSAWPEGYSGLTGAGSSRYPGLFWNDAGTGLVWTEYYTVRDNAVVSETVKACEWETGEIQIRTDDDELYSLNESAYKIPLEMYTYEEITAMDWFAYACPGEQSRYTDLWTAIDQSGVCRFLSMNYLEVRRTAGELDYVYMAPDEMLFYNFSFRDMPGYAFDFDADFSEVVEPTDFFELEGFVAERYVDGWEPCRGVRVNALSLLGFAGSVNAREIGATVSDFMNDGELWIAEVVRGGYRYVFFCDQDGTIRETGACWILPYEGGDPA
jgi:hypothetical protein